MCSGVTYGRTQRCQQESNLPQMVKLMVMRPTAAQSWALKCYSCRSRQWNIFSQTVLVKMSLFLYLFCVNPNETLGCYYAALFHSVGGQLSPHPADASLASIWTVNQLITLKRKRKEKRNKKDTEKVPAHTTAITCFTLVHTFNPLITDVFWICSAILYLLISFGLCDQRNRTGLLSLDIYCRCILDMLSVYKNTICTQD